MSVGEVKTLLTVPEAARALRIGRSTAYDLAHAWLDSGGTKGLPVVVIGGSLRVPVVALERLFAIGGFGPGWQSGLDGRRTKTRPAAGGGDAADAGAASDKPIGPKGAETIVTSGASEPASESTSNTDPPPVESVTLEAESAPPEPRTAKPRPPRRRTITASAQLSLFDTPEP